MELVIGIGVGVVLGMYVTSHKEFEKNLRDFDEKNKS